MQRSDRREGVPGGWAKLEAMADVTASRTLVKSHPELWTECSDAESLARHLGRFGEIRITRLEPETAVAWEGEHASGTVRLEPSGWGTRVVLTATSAYTDGPDEPAPAVEQAPPDLASAEAGGARSAAPVSAEAVPWTPAPQRAYSALPRSPAARPSAAPARRPGLFARMLAAFGARKPPASGVGRRPVPVRPAQARVRQPIPVPVVAMPEATAGTTASRRYPPAGMAPAPMTAAASLRWGESAARQAPDAPEEPAATATAGLSEESAATATAGLSEESAATATAGPSEDSAVTTVIDKIVAAQEPSGIDAHAALRAALDSLGQAHHRPYSRA